MSIIVETLDGERVDFKDYGLRLLSFDIDSPTPILNNESMDGRDGDVDMGSTYGPRNIKISFIINATDLYDSLLSRNDIFRIFSGITPFYLINSYEPMKRWKVKLASTYTPNLTPPYRTAFEISLVSSSPYAESVGTTLDPFTFDSEKWQVGQGIIAENLVYAHSTSFFRIYNGSDIEIDPRKIPLLIKYRGASKDLKIKNITTGDQWTFTGVSNANDNIVLDGVRSTKNGLTIFSKTNHKLITLARGWNEFQLSGTVNPFLISFEFKFYTI